MYQSTVALTFAAFVVHCSFVVPIVPQAAVNISHSYWHYSSYCNTGADFGNLKVPDETFGACILGWGAGDSSKCAGDASSREYSARWKMGV